MHVKCSQDHIDLNIPKKYKRVGIKLSGGIDSSLMAYLLLKYKKTERPDIKIIPITGIIDTRPFQYITAQKIKEKVASLLDMSLQDSFEPHITFSMRTDTIKLAQWEELIRLYTTKVIDSHLWGVTENPPPEVKACYNEHRDKERDPLPDGKKRPTSNENLFYPFANVNKRGIREIYENEGILEELFPLTRSCEIDNTYVFNSDTVCRRSFCWWCQERFWGFGTYD